jgi:hypothetical protein
VRALLVSPSESSVSPLGRPSCLDEPFSFRIGSSFGALVSPVCARMG